MTIWKAILVGQLIVNVPSVAMMIGVLFLGGFVVPWPLALLAGSLLAWIWWSHSVSRWREWAVSRGTDPERLRKFAVRTGLIWPKVRVLRRPNLNESNRLLAIQDP